MALSAQQIYEKYRDLIRGGRPEFRIPGQRKIRRMTRRQLKRAHAPGAAALGLMIRIEFEHALSAADVPSASNWDRREIFTSEHDWVLFNWFVGFVESEGVWTVIGAPQESDRVSDEILVEADDRLSETEQVEKLDAFLNALAAQPFVRAVQATWIDLWHMSFITEDAFSFHTERRANPALKA